jgi:hypothetical protein
MALGIREVQISNGAHGVIFMQRGGTCKDKNGFAQAATAALSRND